jgi:ribosomal protein S18 acetylase RimI-like enzyme
VSPSLRSPSADELSQFVASQLEPYIAERIAAGESPGEARRRAESQMADLFPDGRPSPGQIVYRVIDDDGSAVGWLWVGPHTPQQPQAFWVWSVEIEPAHQGRGLGRAAMELAEEAAREQGATELGLNVFGPNAVARHLYESLGYQTRTVQMYKPLD